MKNCLYSKYEKIVHWLDQNRCLVLNEQEQLVLRQYDKSIGWYSAHTLMSPWNDEFRDVILELVKEINGDNKDGYY